MHVWKPSRLSSYGSFPRHAWSFRRSAWSQRSPWLQMLRHWELQESCRKTKEDAQLNSYLARKLNPHERSNNYSACDLEGLAVCESVKYWRCYLEGCSRFLVVRDHDTLRHLLWQSNTIYSLHVPPIPWHAVGLDYLTHLLVSNGFDNVLIVVDHLT
jgi:hypothetical protein